MLDIDAEQVREDIARASLMALSFTAQSARGRELPMVTQREVNQAHSIVGRFMIRWRSEPDPITLRQSTPTGCAPQNTA